MSRIARAIFPGVPHHVTQRGNGRAQTFFTPKDYRTYRDRLADYSAAANVDVWAWVLMPNHVHLILVPHDTDGLRRTLAPLHRYYAGHVHMRLGRSGHFWQGRYGCVAMDEQHLRAALRYVMQNPVRAGLCESPEQWPWSSIHAYLGEQDGLTQCAPVLARYPDVLALVDPDKEDLLVRNLRRAESIGRPCGSDSFIADLEARTGKVFRPLKPGPRQQSR